MPATFAAPFTAISALLMPSVSRYRTLLRERWPVTLRVAGIGLLLAWLLASILAFTACLWRRPAYEILGSTLSGAFLCIPAAVLALLSVILNAPGYLAIALIVFPENLPLFAEPARQSLCLASYHGRAFSRTGRTAYSGLACAPGRWAANDRAGRRHGQHRARRQHSRRILVRTARHRPTGLAGRSFQRPPFAREPYRAGYTRNLAGELRGRCNDLHIEASRRHESRMNAARKLACVVVLAVCALSLARKLAGASGIRQTISRSCRTRLLRISICSAPMKLAATASPAFSTARASRCCLLPPLLWFQPRWRRWSAASPDTLAGSGSGWPAAFTDLFLSLPWLFLLITVRALMPLNVSPLVSVLITFLILGLLGWAASARVLSTSADALRNSDFVFRPAPPASTVRGFSWFTFCLI